VRAADRAQRALIEVSKAESSLPAATASNRLKRDLHAAIDRGDSVAYRLHLVGGQLLLNSVHAFVTECFLEGTRVRKPRRWPYRAAILAPAVALLALFHLARRTA